MPKEYGPITEYIEKRRDSLIIDQELMDNLSELFEERRSVGLMVVIIGAWGTGKSTYGSLIAEQFDGEYLDGDKDYDRINKLFFSGPSPGDLYIVAASFAERWIDSDKRSQMIKEGRLIYINFIADEATRHSNFYMRRKGRSDVSSILRWKKESPNYIFDDAEYLVDVSVECRTSIDDLRLLIRKLLLGKTGKE